jgi:hypothetical protein
MKSRALAIAAGALVSCQAGFPPGDTGAGKEDNEPSGDPLGLAQVVDADSLSRDPAELAVQADLALRQFRLEDAAALFEAAASAAPSAQSWTYRRAFADALLGLHQDAAAESVYRELLPRGQAPGHVHAAFEPRRSLPATGKDFGSPGSHRPSSRNSSEKTPRR